MELNKPRPVEPFPYNFYDRKIIAYFNKHAFTHLNNRNNASDQVAKSQQATVIIEDDEDSDSAEEIGVKLSKAIKAYFSKKRYLKPHKDLYIKQLIKQISDKEHLTAIPWMIIQKIQEKNLTNSGSAPLTHMFKSVLLELARKKINVLDLKNAHQQTLLEFALEHQDVNTIETILKCNQDLHYNFPYEVYKKLSSQELQEIKNHHNPTIRTIFLDVARFYKPISLRKK